MQMIVVCCWYHSGDPQSRVGWHGGSVDLHGPSDVLGTGSDGLPDLAGPRRQLVRRRGNANNSLAALNFSHQRLQYELSQIVPLAVIVVIGIVFYFLGGKAREEEVGVPIAVADGQASQAAADGPASGAD